MEVIESEIATNDPKRRRVLDGAMSMFLAYGFARTTMDDIARAADMSRPALYLLFRNKSEIYRAIAARMLEESLLEADRALSSQAPVGDRLVRMIDDCIIAMSEVIAASAHGSEILDMKGSLAGDLVADWRSRLADRLERVMDAESVRNGAALDAAGLSARDVAEMLLDCMHGMSLRMPDPAGQRRGARALVAAVEIVLGARRR